ncbi:MAG: sigma-54-dependent Fis family transcriptional regulator [Desulfobacteraceae bacterium]|nr:sigma-54-dependent Fis family transcriptional regulator [Desulfobacteraceae bacterium]
MNNTAINITFPRKRLLIIDDEEKMCNVLTSTLKKTGYFVDTASDGYEGLRMVNKTCYDFILCDLKIPGMGGTGFLRSARDKIGTTTVIMMSANGSRDMAAEAIKLGAYDYIPKPFKPDEVYHVLKKAEEQKVSVKESREQTPKNKDTYQFGRMIAKSRAMESIFKLAEKAAQYNTTVLITGESGTGKELVASGIHHVGKRAGMPFVPVNCGAIPENLLESEFFGYRKGAFTGADRDNKGIFEEANNGTIFLDEIGELPMPLQVKLLRVLQESEIRPVGDSKTKKINVRVIAATAKNLESEVSKGNFRQDLLYRLNVLPVKLPPLRERPEDIPLLSRHFIKKLRRTLDKDIREITPDAMSILLKYKWPGNVRELENVIERASVLTEEPVLSAENFISGLGIDLESDGMDNFFEGYSLKTAQKVLEKKLITKALVATGGNRTKACHLLEISYPSLWSKIKDYNILI